MIDRWWVLLVWNKFLKELKNPRTIVGLWWVSIFLNWMFNLSRSRLSEPISDQMYKLWCITYVLVLVMVHQYKFFKTMVKNLWNGWLRNSSLHINQKMLKDMLKDTFTWIKHKLIIYKIEKNCMINVMCHYKCVIKISVSLHVCQENLCDKYNVSLQMCHKNACANKICVINIMCHYKYTKICSVSLKGY